MERRRLAQRTGRPSTVSHLTTAPRAGRLLVAEAISERSKNPGPRPPVAGAHGRRSLDDGLGDSGLSFLFVLPRDGQPDSAMGSASLN